MTLDAQLEPSKDYRLLVFDTFYLAINTSICTPVHRWCDFTDHDKVAVAGAVRRHAAHRRAVDDDRQLRKVLHGKQCRQTGS